MKKITFILGVIAAAVLLAGCASKGEQAPASPSASVQVEAAPSHHHDLKGEKL